MKSTILWMGTILDNGFNHGFSMVLLPKDVQLFQAQTVGLSASRSLHLTTRGCHPGVAPIYSDTTPSFGQIPAKYASGKSISIHT